ncbi:MAG: hypothetical protein R2830_02550 [Saprospiraceae bacterium]
MRKFYAWLLLTVSTFQWIGGHICLEVSYFMEVEHTMDEVERAIAQEVTEETGVETNVKIIHGDEITPRGHIYSDFFAFSKNVGDETVFYTIEGDPGPITYEQVTTHQQPQGDEDRQASLLKSLYQDFTLPLQALSINCNKGLTISNFQLREILPSFLPTILTPPPDPA